MYRGSQGGVNAHRVGVKQIIAFVKPFRAEAVLARLADLPLEGVEVAEVKGYSRQKSYLDRYVGSEYAMAFLPKVQITAWAEDEVVPDALRCIVEAGRTGRIGDGKILVLPILESESV